MYPWFGGGNDVRKGLHWLGNFSIYLTITSLRLQQSKLKTTATLSDHKDIQNKVRKKNSLMDIIAQLKIWKELPNLTVRKLRTLT